MAVSDLIPWNRNRNVPAPRQGEPANPFVSLHQEVNRLFDNFVRGFDWPMAAPSAWSTGMWPHLEVVDGKDDVRIVAELPGIDEKDLEVTLHDGVLTLRGEKKSENSGTVYSERWHGQFQRSLQLGPDVDPDKVKAEFTNGVLTITAGKRPEAQRQVRRIAINA